MLKYISLTKVSIKCHNKKLSATWPATAQSQLALAAAFHSKPLVHFEKTQCFHGHFVFILSQGFTSSTFLILCTIICLYRYHLLPEDYERAFFFFHLPEVNISCSLVNWTIVIQEYLNQKSVILQG